MSSFKILRTLQMLFSPAATGLAFLLAANSASAAQINITARFLPNANKPDVTSFENTTPSTGYCLTLPRECLNRFSLSMPNSTPYFAIPQGGTFGLKVPHDWRDVTVTHSDGSTQVVKIRIVGMGGRYGLDRPIGSLGTNHFGMWTGSSFVNAPPGCSYGGIGGYNNTMYNFFWMFNSSAECSKRTTVDIPAIRVYGVNFTYELRTPNPLEMSMGRYTGSITYTVGPNGDFKIGEIPASDPILTFNFDLSVQHTLRVQFPINSNLLALQPQGGWQQWLLNGSNQTPQKLMMNQPYQQWSSTNFKMLLQCQYNAGNDCGIQNNAGDTLVAVKTMVTLPNGLQDVNKKPVNRHSLSNTIPSIFYPTFYVDNARAALHFEVDKLGVDAMIKSGSERFRGDVTIIWDSEI